LLKIAVNDKVANTFWEFSQFFQRGSQMTEPWVCVDQVADHLGVVKDSVYRWIETKGLPAHRVGRLWKLKLSEVDDWIRVGGTAKAFSKRKND
jgi:excisionase family DNA binding protein